MTNAPTSLKYSTALVIEAPHITHYRVAMALSKDGFKFSEGHSVNELVVHLPVNMSPEEAQTRIDQLISPVLASLPAGR